MSRENKNKRSIAFYSCVQIKNEARLEPLEQQKKWNETQLKYHPDWTLQVVYIDKYVVGSGRNKRTAFMKLIEDAKNGEFNLVVVKGVCQFARNISESIKFASYLHGLGVEVYFFEEKIWTFDSECESTLTIKDSFSPEKDLKDLGRDLDG